MLMQYDSKLLKLQKQTAQNQCHQSSSVNNEIFRKVSLYIYNWVYNVNALELQKLQHAKAESDREISELNKMVADLKRQLEAGPSSTHQPYQATKKRRIYWSHYFNKLKLKNNNDFNLSNCLNLP